MPSSIKLIFLANVCWTKHFFQIQAAEEPVDGSCIFHLGAAFHPWADVGLLRTTFIPSPLLGSVSSPRKGQLVKTVAEISASRVKPGLGKLPVVMQLPLVGYSCFGGGAKVCSCAIKHEIGKFCV